MQSIKNEDFIDDYGNLFGYILDPENLKQFRQMLAVTKCLIWSFDLTTWIKAEILLFNFILIVLSLVLA